MPELNWIVPEDVYETGMERINNILQKKFAWDHRDLLGSKSQASQSYIWRIFVLN